jgi:hypothetical protein
MSRLERIVAAFGGVLHDNGRRALIAGPGHSDKDRSVSLLETEDGRVLIHCFSPRDDWRAIRDALAARGLLAPRDDEGQARRLDRPAERVIVQPESEDRLARARRWWSEGSPIAGTIGERYLRGRAIGGRLPTSDVLRFHPRMTSLDDKVRRPALLAAIVDTGGKLQGVQATLLAAPDAAKAAVPTPRRVIGRLHGGTVRLAAHEGALIVAEGMETALSASQELSLPAWAALSAGNLAHFDPPRDVTRLVIAADNDPAGAAAAAALSSRFAGEIEIETAPPPPPFNDWNDWARRQRGQ